uniref:Zinc transporter 1-like n=1 Tax=Rhizophora mucronata TaxID=61149 RepID=A0A2P2KDN2_RHIMU
MLSAITTMLIDAFATTYYKRSHFNRSSLEDGNDVKMVPLQHVAHLHVLVHAMHGHAHGAVLFFC